MADYNEKLSKLSLMLLTKISILLKKSDTQIHQLFLLYIIYYIHTHTLPEKITFCQC